MSIAENTRTVATASATTRSHRFVAVVVSVAAAVGTWAVIERVAGFDLLTPAFDGSAAARDLGVGAVIVASLVASLGAWGALALFERYVDHPRRVWTILVVVGFVVSLGGPLSGTSIENSNRYLLALLHLVVATVLIPLLYRTAIPTRNKE